VCVGDNCKHNASLCTKLLLDNNADVNRRNKNGEVPLFLAVKNEWAECAMNILDNDKIKADTTIKCDF